MSADILLFMTHCSHQNATLALSKLFIAKGLSVAYVGPTIGIDGDRLKENIYAQKLPYYSFELYSKSIQEMDSEEDIGQRFVNYFEHLEDRDVFKSLFTELNPKLVLVDIHNPTLLIPISSFAIPVAFISTELVTDRDANIPPLESGYIPDLTSNSAEVINQIWSQFLENKKISQPLISYLKELSSFYEFPFDFLVDYEKSVVSFGFRIIQLVLWSENLDFKRPLSRNRYYLGNLVDGSRHEPVFDWSSINENKTVIYC